MKKGKLIGGALLGIITLYACLNTITLPRFSAVTVAVQANRTVSLSAEPLTLAKQVARYASRLLSMQQANAYIPSIITNVRLTVTAADMDMLTKTENAAGLDSVLISLDVPIGLARSFKVEGLTAGGSTVYSGLEVVHLTGASVSVNITMNPGLLIVPPRVVNTYPLDGAIGIGHRPGIAITFSESMDTRTITDAAFTLVQTATGNPVIGSMVKSDMTVTLLPAADLAPNTSYTATLSIAARSVYGIPLEMSVSWTFTTATIPVVVGTSPASGETGVARNALITAAFSEDMDPATISASTFLFTGPAGTVTYNPAGRTALLETAGILSSDTSYTATITTGARSASGIPLAADHVWSFATGTVADMTPPAFAGISGGTVLSPTSVQLFWLPASDDMTPASSIVYLVSQSTTSGVFTLPPILVSAPGVTSITVTGMAPGTVYYFKVNARDEGGNIETNTTQWWSTPPGRFVKTTGSDTTGDGSETNPYRSITKALSTISSTNAIAVGIYTGDGQYNGANGEAFPLQLAPLTTLFCQGPGNTTVIDATGSGANALYGNSGAVIDSCKVIAEAGRTGIDDSIGGAGGTPGTPARISVISTVVSGAAKTAVTLSANSSVTTSTITGTGEKGIVIRSGRPSVISNAIMGLQTGIEVAADTDPSIDGNRIENNRIGIVVTAAGGRPSVRSNFISNNDIGVQVAAGAPLIHKNEVRTNTIAGNRIGVEILGGMPTITFNTISSNVTGVTVSGGTPAIKSNSLYCNTEADLFVRIDAQIDARNNDWNNVPPAMGQANSVSPYCSAGVDICYTYDPTGIPIFTPSGTALGNSCP